MWAYNLRIDKTLLDHRDRVHKGLLVMIILPPAIQFLLWYECKTHNKQGHHTNLDIERQQILLAKSQNGSGDTITSENTNRDTDLQQGEPQGFLVLPEFINPDWIVNQQENLKSPNQKPTNICRPFVITEDKQPKRPLQQHKGKERKHFRIEPEIQMPGKSSNNNNAQIHNAAQETQFGLVHMETLFHFVGAGGQNSVVQVYENVGEGHQQEDHCGGFGGLTEWRAGIHGGQGLVGGGIGFLVVILSLHQQQYMYYFF